MKRPCEENDVRDRSKTQLKGTQPDGGYKTTGLEELHEQLFAEEGNMHPGHWEGHHDEYDGDAKMMMLVVATLMRMIRNKMPKTLALALIGLVTTLLAMVTSLLC